MCLSFPHTRMSDRNQAPAHLGGPARHPGSHPLSHMLCAHTALHPLVHTHFPVHMQFPRKHVNGHLSKDVLFSQPRSCSTNLLTTYAVTTFTYFLRVIRRHAHTRAHMNSHIRIYECTHTSSQTYIHSDALAFSHIFTYTRSKFISMRLCAARHTPMSTNAHSCSDSILSASWPPLCMMISADA